MEQRKPDCFAKQPEHILNVKQRRNNKRRYHHKMLPERYDDIKTGNSLYGARQTAARAIYSRKLIYPATRNANGIGIDNPHSAHKQQNKNDRNGTN